MLEFDPFTKILEEVWDVRSPGVLKEFFLPKFSEFYTGFEISVENMQDLYQQTDLRLKLVPDGIWEGLRTFFENRSFDFVVVLIPTEDYYPLNYARVANVFLVDAEEAGRALEDYCIIFECYPSEKNEALTEPRYIQFRGSRFSPPSFPPSLLLAEESNDFAEEMVELY